MSGPHRFLLASALVLACGSAACPDNGSGSTSDADAALEDADTTEDDGGEDVTPGDPRCCPAGVCAPGKVCRAGVCLPQPGSAGCYADGECKPGQTCEGATVCTECTDDSCEAAPGTCRYPAGCCNADADCGGGEICVEGNCRAKPADGGCWRVDQCGENQTCEGGTSCPCGVEGCTAAPGACAAAGPCCLTDAECRDGRCADGMCVPKLDSGRCLVDGDCGSGVCAGASVCGCGDGSCPVPTTTGACTDAASAACVTAADCSPGQLCVDGKACLVAPTPGNCYLDAHCGPGRVCDGAFVCPEGDSCEQSTTMGVCRTPVLDCTSDDDCAAGLRCALPDVYFCPGEDDPTIGVCVPLEEEGQCWSSDDCGPNLRCTAEAICTDPTGCLEPHKPGYCETFPVEGDCCQSHRDCGPGTECRNSNTLKTCPPNGTAVCLPEVDFGESCWNYFDCPAGMVCNMAFVCACGAKCAKSRDGVCQLASEQFCNSDTDCGTDSTCARDLECIYNPCFNTDDCPLGGRCYKDQVGKCWSHNECGDDEFCEGLKICPDNMGCPDNDQPGTCAPKAEAGECCSSYFACANGLRCVSAANKDECILDLSSTCTPYGVYNQECYVDADCAPSRECVGANVCVCGQGDCTPQPGACVLKTF